MRVLLNDAINWIAVEWINMEHWRNDTDRGKPKHRERNLSQRPFVHHKPRMEWPTIGPGSSRWDAGD
jgi:hypothetical protein